MAHCEFAGGIENVRGTLKKETYFFNGKKVTRSVVASVRGGKQRLYLRTYRERSTPITEKEKLIRSRFSAATIYWNSLFDEQKQRFREEYNRSKCMFNGKKYKTLRGYVIARFFAGALES